MGHYSELEGFQSTSRLTLPMPPTMHNILKLLSKVLFDMPKIQKLEVGMQNIDFFQIQNWRFAITGYASVAETSAQRAPILFPSKPSENQSHSGNRVPLSDGQKCDSHTISSTPSLSSKGIIAIGGALRLRLESISSISSEPALGTSDPGTEGALAVLRAGFSGSTMLSSSVESISSTSSESVLGRSERGISSAFLEATDFFCGLTVFRVGFSGGTML
ncbi:hypothetical protein K438DRAFT_1773381 [Mycena galopus ATCC 62051]|nr:hypothetical protein K438DRAFT_1773381 [Mycena galopus ATCC 62051]